jgi:hypothetical protein
MRNQVPIFPTVTPIPTWTPIPSPTPLITPSPTPAAPGCRFGAFDIEIGSTVTVRPGVNIRAAPTVSSAWLANFQEPRNFVVLDGPVCANEYFWWKLEGHGVIGWVAERSNTMDFITFIVAPEGPRGCINTLNLSVGEQIDLIADVRIRLEPGLEGLVLTVAPFDAPVTVLSAEPRCVDGYNWRLVRVTVANYTYEGWMAEGSALTPELFYVAPTLDPFAECNPPLNLTVGAQRRVRYFDRQPKVLRAAPSDDAEALYMLVDGVPFEVVGGPVCSEGMNFWQVRILSNIPATGWLAEGPRPNYWSEPFIEPNRYPPVR